MLRPEKLVLAEPRMLVSFKRLKPSPIRLSLANSPRRISFLKRRSNELNGLAKLMPEGTVLSVPPAPKFSRMA